MTIRLAVLAAAVASAFAVTPTAGGHSFAQFGHYNLNYPCCNNDNLFGTRASIRPNSMSMGGQAQCIAFRSSAETSLRSIQTGVVKCFNGRNVGGTCSTTGLLERYVETSVGSDYTCYPKGQTSFGTDARFTVQRTQPNTWYAFIAGVQDSHPLTGMENAEILVEGGEYTTSCSGTWGASASYALSTAYSRYNGSSWVNVQSSYSHKDCGWTVNGGPTGSWSVVR